MRPTFPTILRIVLAPPRLGCEDPRPPVGLGAAGRADDVVGRPGGKRTSYAGLAAGTPWRIDRAVAKVQEVR